MEEPNLILEKHFTVERSQQTVIEILSTLCPQISKQKLKLAMRYGAVWVTRQSKTNRIRRAKNVLQVGEQLHLYFNEQILLGKVKPAELIADEGAYSVWNKPCGMFSQGTKWGDHSAICRWVELYGLTDRQAFLVHRLDRATRGLILIAHEKKVLTQLTVMFEQRQIEKHYRARVKNKFPEVAELNVIDHDIDGKKAVTRMINIDYAKQSNISQLLLKIETGRKHQIRKHLSAIGFPILGDRLYDPVGDESVVDKKCLPDLQLQACYLSFICPLTGKNKKYELEADFRF